jgi:hypothetical protein
MEHVSQCAIYRYSVPSTIDVKFPEFLIMERKRERTRKKWEISRKNEHFIFNITKLTLLKQLKDITLSFLDNFIRLFLIFSKNDFYVIIK